jgi:hypothetical protein
VGLPLTFLFMGMKAASRSIAVTSPTTPTNFNNNSTGFAAIKNQTWEGGIPPNGGTSPRPTALRQQGGRGRIPDQFVSCFTLRERAFRLLTSGYARSLAFPTNPYSLRCVPGLSGQGTKQACRFPQIFLRKIWGALLTIIY